MQRSSGILLHPTALPGPHGIGALGPEAYRFVDFLVAAGQKVWQILPLGPTGFGNSPYNALSAFAGNSLLIDLGQLIRLGDLLPSETSDSIFTEGAVSEQAIRFKRAILKQAGWRFFEQAVPARRSGFDSFCHSHASWLDDFALFMALREYFEKQSWAFWPEEIRRRDPLAMSHWHDQLTQEMALHRYQQYIFYEQWLALKNHANRLGISIVGDIPIFVAYDSADVWTHQELFQLDEEG